jgi:hypothetical protein
VNVPSVYLKVTLSAWVLVACGSSSDNGTGTSRAGGTNGEASNGAPSCTAIGPPSCDTGKTCCYSGLSGTCQEPSACSSPVRFACQGPTSCAAGEVCCSSIPFDQAIDASALTPEGGLGALGITATSICSRSCSAPSFSFCRTPADCTGGATCELLPEGNAILLLLGAETAGVCTPLDGGTSLYGDGAFEGSDSAGDASDAPISD